MKTPPPTPKQVRQAIDAYEDARSAWHAWEQITGDEADRLWDEHDKALDCLLRVLRAAGHTCESKAFTREETRYYAQSGSNCHPLVRVSIPTPRAPRRKDGFVRDICGMNRRRPKS